jgi:hypothetical protein
VSVRDLWSDLDNHVCISGAKCGGGGDRKPHVCPAYIGRILFGVVTVRCAAIFHSTRRGGARGLSKLLSDARFLVSGPVADHLQHGFALAGRRWAWFNLFPLIMYACDMLENINHYSLAGSFPDLPAWQLQVGPVLSLIKYILITALPPLALVGFWCKRKPVPNRGASS